MKSSKKVGGEKQSAQDLFLFFTKLNFIKSLKLMELYFFAFKVTETVYTVRMHC